MLCRKYFRQTQPEKFPKGIDKALLPAERPQVISMSKSEKYVSRNLGASFTVVFILDLEDVKSDREVIQLLFDHALSGWNRH